MMNNQTLIEKLRAQGHTNEEIGALIAEVLQVAGELLNVYLRWDMGWTNERLLEEWHSIDGVSREALTIVPQLIQELEVQRWRVLEERHWDTLEPRISFLSDAIVKEDGE